ncbi:hypothetical protein T492DRAFT_1084226 [Pavlovales sp. CCMP2436]|nr:hypothetical protein T492DRAFT_1084226 [Pavlovales sp. CCMP2436]
MAPFVFARGGHGILLSLIAGLGWASSASASALHARPLPGAGLADRRCWPPPPPGAGFAAQRSWPIVAQRCWPGSTRPIRRSESRPRVSMRASRGEEPASKPFSLQRSLEEFFGAEKVRFFAIVLGILPYPLILFSLLTSGEPHG